MSIKRSKASSRGKDKDIDSPIFGKKKEVEPKWSWKEHVAAEPEDAFAAYEMGKSFDKKSLITHPKFGKGLVISVEGGRLEVLFEDATRKLAHGG
jgi:hypothetical protein